MKVNLCIGVIIDLVLDRPKQSRKTNRLMAEAVRRLFAALLDIQSELGPLDSPELANWRNWLQSALA